MSRKPILEMLEFDWDEPVTKRVRILNRLCTKIVLLQPTQKLILKVANILEFYSDLKLVQHFISPPLKSVFGSYQGP